MIPCVPSLQWFFATFCGVSKERFLSSNFEALDEHTPILDHLNGCVKPYDGERRSAPTHSAACPQSEPCPHTHTHSLSPA